MQRGRNQAHNNVWGQEGVRCNRGSDDVRELGHPAAVGAHHFRRHTLIKLLTRARTSSSRLVGPDGPRELELAALVDGGGGGGGGGIGGVLVAEAVVVAWRRGGAAPAGCWRRRGGDRLRRGRVFGTMCALAARTRAAIRWVAGAPGCATEEGLAAGDGVLVEPRRGENCCGPVLRRLLEETEVGLAGALWRGPCPSAGGRGGAVSRQRGRSMKTPRWTEAVLEGAASSAEGRAARRWSPRKARDPTQRHPPVGPEASCSPADVTGGAQQGGCGGLRSHRSCGKAGGL